MDPPTDTPSSRVVALLEPRLNASVVSSPSPWLFCLFPNLCLEKVSFYPADSEYGINQMPQKFQFIGSNDEVCDARSTWLCSPWNQKVESVINFDETRGCEISDGSGAPFPGFKFRCLGIKIFQAGLATAVRGIQMWKKGFCWESSYGISWFCRQFVTHVNPFSIISTTPNSKM